MANDRRRTDVRKGSSTRTTRPYYWLHKALGRSLERLSVQEGSFFEGLQALITAALLVECYLNTAGENLLPDWDEKPDRGKSKAFHSIPEKLKFILVEIDRRVRLADIALEETIVPGTDPRFGSLSRVAKFRNLLAHSREETISGEWLDDIETDWELLPKNPAVVRGLCDDCVSLVSTLHRMRVQATGSAENSNPFFSGASESGRRRT